MADSSLSDRFVPDPRANRLQDWKLEQKGSSWFLKYRSSLDTSRHIVGALPRAKPVPVLERTNRWPHRIRFDFPPPTDLEDFLRLLEKALVIARVPEVVDAAIALDFYQRRDRSGELAFTSPGREVRKVKGYDRVRAADADKAGQTLCDWLSEVVINHLWLINATRILPVPGHDPHEESASQLIGRRLAKELNIPSVEVMLRGGLRKPAKSMTTLERKALLNGFRVDEDLDGETVLIVDDFYHTGNTMAGVANAARRAGAKTALGLVATRNLSY